MLVSLVKGEFVPSSVGLCSMPCQRHETALWNPRCLMHVCDGWRSLRFFDRQKFAHAAFFGREKPGENRRRFAVQRIKLVHSNGSGLCLGQRLCEPLVLRLFYKSRPKTIAAQCTGASLRSPPPAAFPTGKAGQAMFARSVVLHENQMRAAKQASALPETQCVGVTAAQRRIKMFLKKAVRSTFGAKGCGVFGKAADH